MLGAEQEEDIIIIVMVLKEECLILMGMVPVVGGIQMLKMYYQKMEYVLFNITNNQKRDGHCPSLFYFSLIPL